MPEYILSVLAALLLAAGISCIRGYVKREKDDIISFLWMVGAVILISNSIQATIAQHDVALERKQIVIEVTNEDPAPGIPVSPEK